MTKAELVFVSVPGIGHLVPLLEFAKRLIAKDDRLSIITILNIKPLPGSGTPTELYTNSISSHCSQSIKIIDLPQADLPSSDPSESFETYLTEYIENHIPIVKSTLSGLMSARSSNSARLAALVLDVTCTSMIDVATELGLPSYLFSPAGAGFLGLALDLPKLQRQLGGELQDADSTSELSVPNFANPLPSTALPSFLFNKRGCAASCKGGSEKMRQLKGIILNSFQELETYAIDSFSRKRNQTIPPVYPVGPVVDAKGRAGAQWDEISDWLDAQPRDSVVLLCFGSAGSFSMAQTKEIAVGLERSGHRFLWSLRQPPAEGNVAFLADCTNPAGILPEGFLDRTVGKGRICGWVPQVKVLAHRAVGGFVSHCGWNSVLESLWNGVPIAAWPLYAEQHLNAFSLVKELGLGVEMSLSYGKTSGDLVAAEEVERAVRCLMDGGSAARKSAREMREKSRRTLMEGGSSFLSLERLIEDMIGSS